MARQLNILPAEVTDRLMQAIKAGDAEQAAPTKQSIADLFDSGALPVDGHVAGKFGLQSLLDLAYSCKSEPLALALLDNPTFLGKFDKHINFLSSTWSIPVLERVLEIRGSIAAGLGREKRLSNWLMEDANEPVLAWFIKHGLPLDSAIEGKRPYIPVLRFGGRLNAARFDLVLRLGADPYTTDDAGRTFLHGAIDGDLKTASSLGDTPRRVEELRNFLVVCNNHFLDLDRPDNEGMTALHHAARFGYANVTAALIEAGADPHAKDHQNRTPADLAHAGKRHGAAAALAAFRAREVILDAVRRARAPGKTD